MDKFTLLPYITEQSAQAAVDKATAIMRENGIDLDSIPWDDFCITKGGFPDMRGGGVYENTDWAEHTRPELLCGMPVRELLGHLHKVNDVDKNCSVVGTSWEHFAQAMSQKIDTLCSELSDSEVVNSVGMWLHSIQESEVGNPYVYFWVVFDFNITFCVDLNLITPANERRAFIDRLQERAAIANHLRELTS